MATDYDAVPNRSKAVYLKRKQNEIIAEKERDKELHENLDLDYRYIRMWDWQNSSSVSFGWKASGNMITYAVALQSKKDKFSRKAARKVINKRFVNDQVQMFTFWSENTVRDMGPILVAHYNSLREIKGVRDVPKYLRHIPVELG